MKKHLISLLTFLVVFGAVIGCGGKKPQPLQKTFQLQSTIASAKSENSRVVHAARILTDQVKPTTQPNLPEVRRQVAIVSEASGNVDTKLTEAAEKTEEVQAETEKLLDVTAKVQAENDKMKEAIFSPKMRLLLLALGVGTIILIVAWVAGSKVNLPFSFIAGLFKKRVK